MTTAFYGKVWLSCVALVLCGAFGVLAITLGTLALTGRLAGIDGEPRTEAGVPLLIVGSVMAVGVVIAVANIRRSLDPVVRCFREGVECTVAGESALDWIPLVPGAVRLLWRVATLECVRSYRVRIPWAGFHGAVVSGPPMARMITLSGRGTNLRTGELTEAVRFDQVRLSDDPHAVARALNAIAHDPDAQGTLPTWSPAA